MNFRDKAHAFGSWRLAPGSYPCYRQNGIQGTSHQIHLSGPYSLFDANTTDISTKKMIYYKCANLTHKAHKKRHYLNCAYFTKQSVN